MREAVACVLARTNLWLVLGSGCGCLLPNHVLLQPYCVVYSVQDSCAMEQVCLLQISLDSTAVESQAAEWRRDLSTFTLKMVT
jgi:hypothetical protein